jgi:hypothetical protein
MPTGQDHFNRIGLTATTDEQLSIERFLLDFLHFVEVSGLLLDRLRGVRIRIKAAASRLYVDRRRRVRGLWRCPAGELGWIVVASTHFSWIVSRDSRYG